MTIVTNPKSWTREQVQERVLSLGPWFHNIDLLGVKTAPHHPLGDFPECKWRHWSQAIPADLTGKSVLDIGCNGGFYALQMKRRGAARVVAIDHDEDYLAQARFAADVCGLDIEFRQLSVYDVATLKSSFDIVLFLGVFYHLRHPLLALDLIFEHSAADMLVFQSMQRGSPRAIPIDPDYSFQERRIFDDPGFPKMHFIEQSYAGDPTNWWVPNRACVKAMLKSAGFEVIRQAEHETFVCRRTKRPSEFAGAVYPAKPRQQNPLEQKDVTVD